MSEFSREFGERLRAAIEESRISQRQVAKRAGISASGLSHFLDGRVPDALTFEKIALVLGENEKVLLHGKGKESVAESAEIYGLPEEEKNLLKLYRGAKEEARDDALFLLERHQVVSGEQKVKPEQRAGTLGGEPWTEEQTQAAAKKLESLANQQEGGSQIDRKVKRKK